MRLGACFFFFRWELLSHCIGHMEEECFGFMKGYMDMDMGEDYMVYGI